MISKDTVVFFGHFSVKRSESRFDVRYGDMEFYRSKGACKGGIGVAVHENTVRFFLYQNFFDLLQHAAGHGSVGGAVDAEVVVWLWNIQLFEEYVRHIGVKVLAGVDDYFCETGGGRREAIMFGNGAGNRSGFYELWTGSYDGYNFHFVKSFTTDAKNVKVKFFIFLSTRFFLFCISYRILYT